jgi:hypothetical protein
VRPQGGGKEATVTLYRKVKLVGHPLAHANGAVYAHRAVLWDKIGPGEHRCHWCGRSITWFGPGPRIYPDHLDRNRWNNDPANLEPSCHWCNSYRDRRPDFLTHCEAGHPWTPENIYFRPDGMGRQCVACNQARERRRVR